MKGRFTFLSKKGHFNLEVRDLQ